MPIFHPSRRLKSIADAHLRYYFLSDEVLKNFPWEERDVWTLPNLVHYGEYSDIDGDETSGAAEMAAFNLTHRAMVRMKDLAESAMKSGSPGGRVVCVKACENECDINGDIVPGIYAGWARSEDGEMQIHVGWSGAVECNELALSF